MRINGLENARPGDVIVCSNGDFEVIAICLDMPAAETVAAKTRGIVAETNCKYAVMRRIPCEYANCKGRIHEDSTGRRRQNDG